MKTITIAGKDVVIPEVHVHQCTSGFNFYNDWLDALETHDLEDIYRTMQRYFFHKNGSNNKPACDGCYYIDRGES